ncbi:MAG: hypothetical protein A3K19_23450 [Lentisphaerae bacterium RIFOXYB12_FULL_65_16]|nr:MAG: hypothetical protein A3K18_20660 [Lentisphaerae bacterium RIFOXYA12_64_32]OGV91225.1 MAG: hypothetical protein A3K19_23450 [Lentisphaerae bacterium RIFOXYB12_FULL_65_16]
MQSALTDYLRTARFTFERGWRHAAPGFCAFHRHQPFEVVYHVVGSGKTTDARGKTIAFEEDGVVMYAPGVTHNQDMTVPGEDICIHIGSDLPWPEELDSSLYVPPPEETRLKAELIALAGLPSNMAPAQQLACDHRAAALLIELLHAADVLEPCHEATPERYVAAARDYIRVHFRDIHDVPEVATAVGIGYDHLRHCFRKAYGMSVKQWHTQVRIERAQDLLLHSNLPLKAIADLCGFENARYFSTCFRRVTGQTPGGCRAAAVPKSPPNTEH